MYVYDRHIKLYSTSCNEAGKIGRIPYCVCAHLLIKGDVLPKPANVIYREMNLASSHDVVQEGVHSVELMGKKAQTTSRCQVRLAVNVAVVEHSGHITHSIGTSNVWTGIILRTAFWHSSNRQAFVVFLDRLFYEPT